MRQRLAFLSALLLVLSGVPAHAQDKNAEQEVHANIRAVMSLYSEGRPREALAEAERVVKMTEARLGPDHFWLAVALMNLAGIRRSLDPAADVHPLYRRAVSIARRSGEPSTLAIAVVSLAQFELEEARRAGRADSALKGMDAALQEARRLLPEGNEWLDQLLESVATTEREAGNYPRALALQREMLEGRRRRLGPTHPNVGSALNGLGTIYFHLGDIPAAYEVYRQALPILERDSARDPVTLATLLDNLALVYIRVGQPHEAAALSERALRLFHSGGGSPEDIALAMSNLAVSLEDADPDRADSLLTAAVELQRSSLGENHPDLAIALNNLAARIQQRDLERAFALQREALRIWEHNFGPWHPNVGTALLRLAFMHASAGQVREAIESAARGSAIESHNLDLVITTGSEAQKRAYTVVMRGHGMTSEVVALHQRYAPGDSTLTRLALTDLLRRKGRVLDAMRDHVHALRGRGAPRELSLIQRWARLRAEVSDIVYSPPDVPRTDETVAHANRLHDEIAELESSLASHAQVRTPEPITLDRIRASLAPGSVLIEFTLYDPAPTLDGPPPEMSARRRYAAYLLFPDGRTESVDLGVAAEIDDVIYALNDELATPGGDGFRPLARALDQKIMRPIRARVGTATHLLLGVEWALSWFPFAVLVDENGDYLAQRYTITYLTSGRDLLRLQEPAAAATAPLVIGAPLYDTVSTPATGPERSSGGAHPAELQFTPLASTGSEAASVAALLPGARMLTGPEATEGAVKSAMSPRILHLATHAFFLPDLGDLPGDSVDVAPEAWLLRSGVALAGANLRRDSGGEDGVLTSYEAVTLDLRGTQLVVLSACETAEGTILVGEGLYGIPRAFLLAGAAAEVVTMWKVEDTATRDFMVEYYGRLRRGEGRGEALRQTQLSTLQNPDRADPYYWAPFVMIGDWRPLPRTGTP